MKQEDYQEYYKEIPVKSNPNGPQGKKNNMNTQVLQDVSRKNLYNEAEERPLTGVRKDF